MIATLMPHRINHGDASLAYFNKIWGILDPHAMSGYWDSDLACDLDAIRKWGAAAVVTLIEPAELKMLRVERLGEEVAAR